MADKKLTALTALSTPADGDKIYIVDVSDTTDSEAGTSKYTLLSNARGWPQTSAESTAGITPTNLQYAPGNALRYGATGNGSTNDYTALNKWLTCGEKYLVLPPGTYMTGQALTLAETSGVGRIQGVGMPVIKRADDVGTSAILSVYDENEVIIDGIVFDGNQTGIAPVSDPTAWADLALIATLTASPNTSTQTDYFVSVTNCQFKDSPGSAIAGAGLQNVIVSNCRFVEWLDHAVYVSGDAGASRGLGSNLIVNGNIFYCSADANGCIKARNNVRKVVVSDNSFEMSDSVIQLSAGDGVGGTTDFNPREVVVTGNTGTCSYVLEHTGDTSATVSDQAHYLFADNNFTCSTHGFYLGDSASSTFSGYLLIKGGVYRNGAGSFKALLDSRYLDNANQETGITLDGVTLKDFAVKQGAWPKKFIMRNCTCDETYATWFLYVSADDTTVKHVQIEGNSFLNPASGQGGCQFAIHDDSTFIFRNNHMDTDGYVQLRDFPEIVIIEGNTFIDVAGLIIDSAATARSTAGVLILSRNSMISTAGASINVRLFEENTAATCLLDSYNVFCMNNYFRDSTNGLYCIGSSVTGYAGSNVFYANGNYGIGSSVSVTYPAANRSSFLPHLQIENEYTITNDTTDRTFDANANSTLELADVVATLLKDLGHGA